MNKDTEEFDAWAAHGHWSNWRTHTGKQEHLRRLVDAVCRQIPAGEHWTTKTLVDHMLPGLTGMGKNYIGSGLLRLRQSERLAGLWRTGPRGRGGNLSIQWINPGVADFPEGFL